MTGKHRILWVDDEIDLLKPHILFLEKKGYEVTPVVSGTDAVELLKERPSGWDIVMLDENMPGLSGLETLERLRVISPQTPVVMITKSEEENLMDQAVGNQVRDYLIKPVNPHQILHTLKKLLHETELVTNQATINYRKEFLEIENLISGASSFKDWCEVYRRLTIRLLELESTSPDIVPLLGGQYEDARNAFFRDVRKNYIDWVDSGEILFSHRVLDSVVVDGLDKGEKYTVVVMDNFRLDQWMCVRDVFLEYFDIEDEILAAALLPTATQYARNALLSGLLPAEIQRKFPHLWIDEDDERSKNLNEEPLLRHFLDSRGLRDKKLGYYKANDSEQLQKIIGEIRQRNNDLSVIVINFIDILSHSRTDSRMLKELLSGDAAYRSLTLSWFRHSSFTELLSTIASNGSHLCFTTDHGSIRVDKALKVVGDRETNTAIRYKVGRNLAYPPKEVLAIKDPAVAGLPSTGISTEYIFAGGTDFFAYANDFNHYSRYFTGTYQHGGVSFEEMIVPLIKFRKKR